MATKLTCRPDLMMSDDWSRADVELLGRQGSFWHFCEVPTGPESVCLSG